MPYYKDPRNKVHYIDDDVFSHLLPDGSVQISDEEAESLNPTPIPANPRISEIKAALAEIDAKSIRPIREGDTSRLAALEAQAETLRQELRNAPAYL